MEENVLAKPHPSATPPSAFADRPSYKWWVTWTIMVGSFLFALDTTIVNIAIPKIMTSISADLNQIQWVLIIYMIGMAVVMPAAGWLSDLFGHGTLLGHFSAHVSLVVPGRNNPSLYTVNGRPLYVHLNGLAIV